MLGDVIALPDAQRRPIVVEEGIDTPSINPLPRPKLGMSRCRKGTDQQ